MAYVLALNIASYIYLETQLSIAVITRDYAYLGMMEAFPTSSPSPSSVVYLFVASHSATALNLPTSLPQHPHPEATRHIRIWTQWMATISNRLMSKRSPSLRHLSTLFHVTRK